MKENNNENSLTLRGMLIGKSDESIALGKTFIGIDFGTSTTVGENGAYPPTQSQSIRSFECIKKA